ncbi:hypothetical protein K466DRAFT_192318 [Polyporus arcularius HHB13444]|uniref:Uncharacterized protein n=1 Tax=Polyporus arcularius HHB13444 TaxID=1314778 RepID=A0A5C3P721_9APHY|nr:hypothetical protein K466DRAFT_192318 [Polyporus arcularius HHB13444]
MPRATNSTPISDVIIDSGQTDLIDYSYAPWTFITGNSTYVNGTATTTTTSSLDEKVRYEIRFSFKGTQVAVYGSFPDSRTLGLGGVTGTRSSYTLFASARTMTTTFFQPLLVGEEDHVLFYQSELLPCDNYTLLITVDPGPDPYILDWIEYNTTSPTHRNASPLSGVSSARTTTLLPPSLSSASASALSQPDALHFHAATTTAMIVTGAAAGGLILLLCAALVLKAIMHRRGKARVPNRVLDLARDDYSYNELETPDALPHPTPFPDHRRPTPLPINSRAQTAASSSERKELRRSRTNISYTPVRGDYSESPAHTPSISDSLSAVRSTDAVLSRGASPKLVPLRVATIAEEVVLRSPVEHLEALPAYTLSPTAAGFRRARTLT